MKQLVSVLMPSYNCGKWIEGSIKSILEQDYKELELIIIDDNSSDNTRQIIKKFQESEQRRFLLHKMPYRTKNIAKLLNIGIQLAKGDFIVRQDADDFSFLNRISSQLKFLTDNNIPICGSLFYVILPNGNLLEDKGRIQKIYTSCNDKFSPPLHGTWMMKKSLIDMIGMYDESFPFAQDFEFIYRTAFKHDLKIRNVQKVLYNWRIHNRNITFKEKSERSKYIIRAKQMYSSYIDNSFREPNEFKGLC